MNIKAVYVGNLRSLEVIYSHIFDQSNKVISADVVKLGVKIRALNSKTGQRDKLKTTYGVWFVTNLKGNALGVCTSQTYPERHAYKLLAQLNQFIQQKHPQSKQLKQFATDLCKKMQDPSKFDKLATAQKQVNLLHGQLHKGVNKLLQNQEQLSQLDNHAMQLKGLAAQFHSHAQKIQSISFWKKWKCIFLIIAVILGFVSIVVITILLRIK